MLTCTVVLEVLQVLLHSRVELQEGVPLVQRDALVLRHLQKLQEVRQVGSAVLVQHDRQQAYYDLLLCEKRETPVPSLHE